MNDNKINVNADYDLVCVGAGIMSATLALLIKLVGCNYKTESKNPEKE